MSIKGVKKKGANKGKKTLQRRRLKLRGENELKVRHLKDKRRDWPTGTVFQEKERGCLRSGVGKSASFKETSHQRGLLKKPIRVKVVTSSDLDQKGKKG